MLGLNLLLSIIGGAIAINDGNTGFDNGAAIVNMVLALVWIFLLPVAALFCWLMPVYYAYR